LKHTVHSTKTTIFEKLVILNKKKEPRKKWKFID